MVDIIKFQPSVSHHFPANNQSLRNKLNSQQLNLPIFLSSDYTFTEAEHIKKIDTKRWINYCGHNSSRLLDASNLPYSVHRKVMYQQLSRQCTTTVRIHGSLKTKQQRNASKDTTIGNGGTNTTSQPSFCNSDIQSSHVFKTLSKYITIKPEPLRPSNSFTRSSTSTSTSWQRYWTSTHAQRRRQETIDSDTDLSRPKCKQSIPGQTHFVVLRDSPSLDDGHQTSNEISSTLLSSCSLTKVSTTAIVDKKIFSNEEDDISTLTNQISSIEFVRSSLIPSSIQINSSTNLSKPTANIPLASTDKDDEKNLRKKSLSSSSSSSSSTSSSGLHFKSVSQIIAEISDAQKPIKPIETKVLKLSSREEKPLLRKRSLRRRRSRSKSSEKRLVRTPSASKRKRQILPCQHLSNKSKPSTLSTILTTTSRSKYSGKKWDEPYIGLRFDPPTPPCSPSLYIWPYDSDEEDNQTSLEKSEIFEHNSTTKVLKRCEF
ncbi:unnamed protein product [Rotaria sp. Silwood1]|nr:unnamed protein product [Rotaria sp. Silwood1]CAF3386080.1 unnamed protein product [Rotaria sp. Silwood1]CAF3387945.1 unnamed protein product [Rotaria sp. Silwood1]CAF4698101.1 unnamed protein product [Rotaria sp. Silwood1]